MEIAGRYQAKNNLPHFDPHFFVGREQVLAELHCLLASGQGPAVLSQAISGLGGVGKTRTALAYCYRHLADYTLVWWLRAGSAEVLAADFTTLAEPLGLDPAAPDQAKLIASIRAALQASEGWLLVFDNIEDPELPRTFLPSTGKGHALITSRRTDWQGIAGALPLKVMEEGEALQLLTGRPDPAALPAAELAEAKALAQDLGYLPLALAQARAYMAEAGKSLAGYRRLLQATWPEVLDRGRASRDYPTSVAKTWQISIEAAEDTCGAARPLLELLAFFAADPLPIAVLGADPEALPAGLRGELERDEAIRALTRFSLIQAEEDTVTVHRLIQAVTYDGLDETTAWIRNTTAMNLITAVMEAMPLRLRLTGIPLTDMQPGKAIPSWVHTRLLEVMSLSRKLLSHNMAATEPNRRHVLRLREKHPGNPLWERYADIVAKNRKSHAALREKIDGFEEAIRIRLRRDSSPPERPASP